MRTTTAQAAERGATLALLPFAATLGYYALPAQLQTQRFVQFAPQIIAYLAFALWAALNRTVLSRFGLEKHKLGQGGKIGLSTGLLLGGLNSLVILRAFPNWGYDITFLKDAPHAQLPVLVMVPWLIVGIALFVEVNFRGFLLGRLAVLESNFWNLPSIRHLSPLALVTSAFVFAFDPFMVNTFRHLHWIAVWDGLIWGIIWLRTGNLYATIIAHATEVIIVYSAVRSVLMS